MQLISLADYETEKIVYIVSGCLGRLGDILAVLSSWADWIGILRSELQKRTSIKAKTKVLVRLLELIFIIERFSRQRRCQLTNISSYIIKMLFYLGKVILINIFNTLIRISIFTHLYNSIIHPIKHVYTVVYKMM